MQNPLKFHINNLNSNIINLTINHKIPEYDNLKDISNIRITIENNINLENILLYLKVVTLINPEKK